MAFRAEISRLGRARFSTAGIPTEYSLPTISFFSLNSRQLTRTPLGPARYTAT